MAKKNRLKEDLDAFADGLGLDVKTAANGVKTVAVPIESGSIQFPTDARMHLLCAKLKKDQAPLAEHGVSFHRVGEDCHVFASDGKSGMRLILVGEGENVPERGAVAPRRAIETACKSEEELVGIAFAKGKIHVTSGSERHSFRLIEVLPFPDEGRQAFDGATTAAKSIRGCLINASQLARVQKALGADYVELRQPRRGMVLALPPAPNEGVRVGALALWSSIEEAAQP